MNTECTMNTEQLARDTAKIISEWEAKTYGKPDYSHPSMEKEQEVLTGFIQSALEQAVAEAEQRVSQAWLNAGKQQPRCEKWRVARFTKHGKTLFRILQGEQLIAVFSNEGFAQHIADAHNASIGADVGERGKYECGGTDEYCPAKDQLEDLQQRLQQAEAEYQRMGAKYHDACLRLQQAEKDTERMDWLEAQRLNGTPAVKLRGHGITANHTVREAIDAARHGEKGKA